MSYRRFAGVVLVVLLIDQVSKLLAVHYLYPYQVVKLLDSLLRLTLVYNTQGVFGISFGGGVTYYILPLIGIALVVYFAHKAKGGLYSLAFGMILGGAIGNLLDRLRMGKVVDFVDMGIGDLRWPTYNLADASIVIAVFLLFLAESKK